MKSKQSVNQISQWQPVIDVENRKTIPCKTYVQHCLTSRIGLVESKVRILTTNLENTQYVMLAHVKPKSFPALEPDK